jgi:hypothetical protein
VVWYIRQDEWQEEGLKRLAKPPQQMEEPGDYNGLLKSIGADVPAYNYLIIFASFFLPHEIVSSTNGFFFFMTTRDSRFCLVRGRI